MNGQTSLLEPEPVVPPAPRALVEFLAGVATAFAFGDNPTAAQKREGAKVAAELGARLAELRARGEA